MPEQAKMQTHSGIAAENFKKGYNCAQSVFIAYAGEYGISKNTALKLSSSFGGGMGRLREVCGAVSGMFMIAGLAKGYTENNNDEAKAGHYKFIQTLAGEFIARHNTIICRELLGLDKNEETEFVPSKRTEEYYTQRPCEKFIVSACEILDKYLPNTANTDS